MRIAQMYSSRGDSVSGEAVMPSLRIRDCVQFTCQPLGIANCWAVVVVIKRRITAVVNVEDIEGAQLGTRFPKDSGIPIEDTGVVVVRGQGLLDQRRNSESVGPCSSRALPGIEPRGNLHIGVQYANLQDCASMRRELNGGTFMRKKD